MKLYELLSAIEEEQYPAVSQMNIVNKDSGDKTELAELINDLSDIRQYITTPNIEELRKLTAEKEKLISKTERLEKKLKTYEEVEKERIASQENLIQMKERIDRRNNADERFEGLSGIQYIEETGALIGQYGEEVAKLNQLNNCLNDDRAEYHRDKAEHFSLLGEIESYREKIDKLRHVDTEKGDMVLTLDYMIDALQELERFFSSDLSGQEEASATTADVLKMLRTFVSMLEVKVHDYALVLPERFLEEIREIL